MLPCNFPLPIHIFPCITGDPRIIQLFLAYWSSICLICSRLNRIAIFIYRVESLIHLVGNTSAAGSILHDGLHYFIKDILKVFAGFRLEEQILAILILAGYFLHEIGATIHVLCTQANRNQLDTLVLKVFRLIFNILLHLTISLSIPGCTVLSSNHSCAVSNQDRIPLVCRNTAPFPVKRLSIL